MNTKTISVPKEMLDKLIVYLHSVGDDGVMSWVDIIETYVEMWEHFHLTVTKRDDLCNYCCEEDHEICFEFKPNSDCVCCADTVRLNSTPK